MTRLALMAAIACVAASAVLGLSLATPAHAASGHVLKYQTAKRHAVRAARKRARQDRRITSWELVRAFRLERHKFVFAWFAQLADGRGCTAQLVTRYSSQRSRKVIAYFRLEECS